MLRYGRGRKLEKLRRIRGSKFDDRRYRPLLVSICSSHNNLAAWVNLSDNTLSPLHQVQSSKRRYMFIHSRIDEAGVLT
jgi:hypothetical protein